MSELVLQLKKINKYFGKTHVIKDVDIDFERGHFVTFLGPSGCGKTTLLRMVAGFYEPDEGEILLNGKRIEKIPPYGRNTAMVFQEYALFPHMNVFDNVSYGLRVKHKPKKEIETRVTEALELMQLKGMQNRYPNQMSGGQQQRVAVARALVMNPDLLLLDEPLSNLDAKLRESVRVELREIQKKMGLSTIYVTHDQTEAMSLSDQIIIMNKGHIEQVGTPHEIYRHPRSRFVADFIGNANFLEAEVCEVPANGESIKVRLVEEVFEVRYDGEPVRPGDKVQVVLRPESIRVGDEGDIEAEVVNSTYMGNVQEYVVRVRDHELDTEEYNPAGKRIYEPGEKVWLKLQKNSLQAVKS